MIVCVRVRAFNSLCAEGDGTEGKAHFRQKKRGIHSFHSTNEEGYLTSKNYQKLTFALFKILDIFPFLQVFSSVDFFVCKCDDHLQRKHELKVVCTRASISTIHLVHMAIMRMKNDKTREAQRENEIVNCEIIIFMCTLCAIFCNT